MRSGPLIAGSLGMSDGQLGHDHDVDRLSGIPKVGRDRFFDVPMKFVQRSALGKDVLANAPRAPGLAVKVALNLDQHAASIAQAQHARQSFSLRACHRQDCMEEALVDQGDRSRREAVEVLREGDHKTY